MKIATVIVTYNRKELLLECVRAVLDQTQKVDEILLIDNNSTDGTYEYLFEHKILEHENVTYIRLEKNIGGSGGFYEGMKIAREKKYDWVWVMDDDTIPHNDCLEKLLNAKDRITKKASFFASSIYGENGEFMNVPAIDDRVESNGYASWYRYLAKGMVTIRDATFVSILINGEAIKKCGLPIKDYFIWGDDTEYTTRIVRNYGNAYLVGDSVAIHKRKNVKHTTLLYEDNKNRISMYYYMCRNNMINNKLYGGTKGVCKAYVKNIINTFKILFSKTQYKMKKIIVIHKGILAYFFKRYDYEAVKNRFQN